MKYIIAWFILFAGLVVFLGCLNWGSYYQIAIDGVCSKAIVLELLPQQHQLVSYRYEVDGRILSGKAQSRPPNPSLDHLKVGQDVVIYYNRSHPDRSILGYPRPIIIHESISIILAALVFPTLIVLIWRAKSGHH